MRQYPMQIEEFARWLANGERGLSSGAIVERLTGVQVGERGSGRNHPWDRGDFGRCIKLLDSVPAAREHLPLMRDVSPTWAALVDAWPELEVLSKSRHHSLLNDRLNEILGVPR